jgi:hypothetical protein
MGFRPSAGRSKLPGRDAPPFGLGGLEGHVAPSLGYETDGTIASRCTDCQEHCPVVSGLNASPFTVTQEQESSGFVPARKVSVQR